MIPTKKKETKLHVGRRFKVRASQKVQKKSFMLVIQIEIN